MICAGIDIGSITSKAVIMKDKNIIGSSVIFTGYNAQRAGEDVFYDSLYNNQLKKDDIDVIISTGYGRNSIAFADKTQTEILCHGAGAHYFMPEVRSIIDIGGQDSKVILLDDKGKVVDFSMNDKCAAGTGRFLEVMARALEEDLDSISEYALDTIEPAKISSVCTVFAESEVISLISKGDDKKDIIAGINNSVAARIASQARRIGIREPLVMTGGVAKNKGVVKALEDALNIHITTFESAQINGAAGAALLGFNS